MEYSVKLRETHGNDDIEGDDFTCEVTSTFQVILFAESEEQALLLAQERHPYSQVVCAQINI